MIKSRRDFLKTSVLLALVPTVSLRSCVGLKESKQLKKKYKYVKKPLNTIIYNVDTNLYGSSSTGIKRPTIGYNIGIMGLSLESLHAYQKYFSNKYSKYGKINYTIHSSECNEYFSRYYKFMLIEFQPFGRLYSKDIEGCAKLVKEIKKDFSGKYHIWNDLSGGGGSV